MLNLSPGTIIYAIANFLILIFLLKTFLYKPIVKMLDDRKKGIDDALNAAEAAREEVAATSAVISADLAKARQEAEAILAAAKSQGEAAKSRILEDAQAQAQAFTSQARKEIAEEKEAAIHALKEQVADLAILVARKALDGQLTEAQEQNLLRQYESEGKFIQ